MGHVGFIQKLRTEDNRPISYFLELDGNSIPLNPFIGKPIHLIHNGQLQCCACKKLIPKLFGQGFCYPCFMNAPENAPCIIRPELCEAHLGKGRDVDWETQNHVQPHAVYLAISSGLKVGITRWTQIPTRWLDQGAQRAIVVAKTPNRYLAGCIEVALKDHFSDRSAWQALLKGDPDFSINLAAEKQKAKSVLDAQLAPYFFEDNQIYSFSYPILKRPEKVKSMSLAKTPEVSKTLTGILGQYLLFDDDSVMNVRSHTGFGAEWRI